MKTFSEWMAERHPESIDEGFFKNAALALGAAGAIAAGSAGFMGQNTTNDQGRPAAASRDIESDPTFQRDVRLLGRGRATERYNQRTAQKKMRDQLKVKAASSGTFKQGKLTGDYSNNSVTSDDADEYLR